MRSARGERARSPPDVGDAAVVDGHGVGDHDSETHAFELAAEELEKKSVHEHAAREHDGVEAFTGADLVCDAGRCACDGDMEVEREPAAGTPAPIPSKSALISGLEFRTWQSSGRDDSVTEKLAILPVGQILSLSSARQAAASSSMAGSPS